MFWAKARATYGAGSYHAWVGGAPLCRCSSITHPGKPRLKQPVRACGHCARKANT